MCLSKHIYLRYFILKMKSYQEIGSVSKFVHTTSCSFWPFTNISSLHTHIIFVGPSHYQIFPSIPLGICTSYEIMPN